MEAIVNEVHDECKDVKLSKMSAENVSKPVQFYDNYLVSRVFYNLPDYLKDFFENNNSVHFDD